MISMTLERPCMVLLKKTHNAELHHSNNNDLNTEDWEIQLTPELKRKLAGPWQTSIILKLMGRPLRYRALQTKLASIWRPSGMTHFIDIGYGFFIMRFDETKDYHHALMDGPWFVGDQYLHVQAWEANFHPHTAKISTTAVWIRLEQLPIEYYHTEFLKHVGHKLGKLLKVDAITSAAIRGRYARLCVQINMTNPLPKRVKIVSFWQDIVYENLPLLCYRCGRIGHREAHCSEGLTETPTMTPLELDPYADQGTSSPTHETTPWKTVQTRRARARRPPSETSPRGMQHQRDAHTPAKPRVPPTSPQVHVLRNPYVGSAKGQPLDGLTQPVGFHRDKMASNGKSQLLLQPHEVDTDCMQPACMNPVLHRMHHPIKPCILWRIPTLLTSLPPHSQNNSCTMPPSSDHSSTTPTQTNPNLPPHSQNNSYTMPPSSDHSSTTPTQTDPDLHLTPTHHNLPPLPATPNMNTPSSFPHDQAQEMANLKQIWSSLSLGRSNDETVTYI